MKKLILLSGLLLVLAFPAMAQIAPHIDVSAGYSLRVFQEPSGVREGMNGWYGSGEYSVFRWLSGEVEVSGNYRNNGFEGNTSVYTGMIGPQFYPLGHRKITLHGHVLVGEGVYRVHFPAYGGFPSQVNLYWDKTWEAGGGIDYSRSRRWKIRVIQADFGQTHFFAHSQNNYSASIGFVYAFGQK